MMKKIDQSKYLVEISNQIALGKPISHILNYKLSIEPTCKEHTLAIQKMIYDTICSEQTKQVETMPHYFVTIFVHWYMPSSEPTCEYFYTTCGGIYSDNAIKKHTRILFKDIISHIRKKYPEYGIWELTYSLTKKMDALTL
jgi:hypothetical protein